MQIPRDFPKLDAGHFAVLQTDPRTGVPLAHDENWAKPGQAYFRVFPSLEEAEAFCVARLSERRNTEWWIFDYQGAQIKSFMDSEYWHALAAQEISNRPTSFWRRLLNLIGV
jgi:hypothetical protein